MLNTELVDTLYAGLPKERQQELITLLFKNSKQTMNYFKRTKDISLSKLETLADFFHMPLDYFRANSSFSANNIYGSNNNVGNITLSGNLIAENDALRREITSLKKTIEAMEVTIKTKDDMIELLKNGLSQKL
jgi:hypothetical protein